MDLESIQSALHSSQLAQRILGIKALKNYDADTAVPLLASKIHDPEFLVRSLVAMGLRSHKTPEAFSVLLEMLTFDQDTNVRAEAANSLSFFGRVSVSHLVKAFYQNENWLVRRSILACLTEMQAASELLDVCLMALKDEDLTVQESAVVAFASLRGSEHHQIALQQLLNQADADSWRLRLRAAYGLKNFSEPEAQKAIRRLQQDSDHRVVGAALEGLI